MIKLNICVTFYFRDEEDELRWRVDSLKVGKLQSKDDGVWVDRTGQDVIGFTAGKANSLLSRRILDRIRSRYSKIWSMMISFYTVFVSLLATHLEITVAFYPLYLKPGFRGGRGRRKMPQTLNANKKQTDANWWKSHSIKFLLAGRCGERERKGGTFKVVELKLSLKVQLQGNIYVKHVWKILSLIDHVTPASPSFLTCFHPNYLKL